MSRVSFNVLHLLLSRVVYPSIEEHLEAQGWTRKQRKLRPSTRVPGVTLLAEGRMLSLLGAIEEFTRKHCTVLATQVWHHISPFQRAYFPIRRCAHWRPKLP